MSIGTQHCPICEVKIEKLGHKCDPQFLARRDAAMSILTITVNTSTIILNASMTA